MSIASVLVCGGTHGNELSGVYAIKQWHQDPSALQALAPSTALECLMVNEASVSARTRFIDEDMNRQFDMALLERNKALMSAGEPIAHEAKLAQRLNAQYGPKSAEKSSSTDFIIDIHNTTSAMGPTLILLESDEFNRDLGRYVKHHMPSANILIEDQKPYAEHPYFCTLAKQSVMVEVGPQAQGALRAEIYAQTVEMTKHILVFLELYNTDSVPKLGDIQAFRLLEEVAYPLDENGQRSAMIAPSLDGHDFEALENGDDCFVCFDGSTTSWQGDTVYPHFVGEAAYDGLDLAFATAQKCRL